MNNKKQKAISITLLLLGLLLIGLSFMFNNSGNRLSNLIKRDNSIISEEPTLTTSSNNTSDKSGLYLSQKTNNGKKTYYFRGNVTNNYVLFADLTWKIIRINEDGSVRLILDDIMNNELYAFNDKNSDYSYMYYSDSDIKLEVENWYKTNILDRGYDSYVATEMFCEQAKVKYDSKLDGGNATMEDYRNYEPNFKCSVDGNGKGVLKLKVGLITYDELLYAGGYFFKNNDSYYLYNGEYGFWTMSPSGFSSSIYATDWRLHLKGGVNVGNLDLRSQVSPVINLKANVTATGTGTKTDPYVIDIK